MKIFKLLTIASSLLLLWLVVSCSDDDIELYQKEDLIGSYKRNDAMYNQGFELYLSDQVGDYNGILLEYSGGCSENGETCIWGAWGVDYFSWSVKNDLLILEYEDEIVKVNFSISENGNLHFYEPTRLTHYKDLYFIKVN